MYVFVLPLDSALWFLVHKFLMTLITIITISTTCVEPLSRNVILYFPVP